MDERLIYVIVVVIAGLGFLGMQIPGMIRAKRDLDRMEADYRAWLAEHDWRMRGGR